MSKTSLQEASVRRFLKLFYIHRTVLVYDVNVYDTRHVIQYTYLVYTQVIRRSQYKRNFLRGRTTLTQVRVRAVLPANSFLASCGEVGTVHVFCTSVAIFLFRFRRHFIMRPFLYARSAVSETGH